MKKEDVDFLINKLNERGWDPDDTEGLRGDAYRAIGLTETGEPRMEPMKVIRGWAVVSNNGTLCVTGKRSNGIWEGTYSVYGEDERPTLSPDLKEIRRLARVEIREVSNDARRN